MKHCPVSAALVAASIALAAPSIAHAQYRVGAQVGVEHLAREGRSDTMAQARGEVGVRVARSLELGGYAQYLLNPDPQGPRHGWGFGALVTLRPMEDSTVAPMAYGSVGYQLAPDGRDLRGGVFFELGGGLLWRLLPVLDVELRAAFAGHADHDEARTGVNAALALSLHT